jgi:hypothetical protein
MLKSRALTQPDDLTISGAGFVTADYVLADAYRAQLAIPLSAFAEVRLLAIREALLPFGFKNYRVNINGTPPGTGLTRRYGSARYIDGGKVEWLKP